MTRTVRYWCDFHREKANDKAWQERKKLMKMFHCKIVKIVEYR